MKIVFGGGLNRKTTKAAGVALGFFAAMTGSSALASNGSVGYVSNIGINGAGQVSFLHTGSRDPKPTCHIQANNVWGFKSNTAEGQSKLAVLLTAYSQHKHIFIYGSGACDEI